METSSPVAPQAGGRSRFSKVLPKPPSFDNTKNVVLPVRKDSLASRPPLPPKDTTVRPTASSTVAAKAMETPLPPLPGLTKMNSPPTAVPKRKPVGSGVIAKSPPPPQPIRGDDMSPIESLSSLPTAPGGIAAPKDSLTEPSTPKMLPKDTLGGATSKPVLVSPLYLSSPVPSEMGSDPSQSQPGAVRGGVWGGRPQMPWIKDSQTPSTPDSSKALPSVPTEPRSTSPKSLTSHSPPQPQLWRRRSQKSDKNLAVAELKLTSSHGSTAASSTQAGSSPPQDSPLSKPLPPLAGPGQDRSILESPESASGHSIRPSAPNKSLPMDPPAGFSGNKTSQDDLDSFSQYAQEVERDIADGTYKASDLSPARTPEIRHPPTPEYEKDETRVGVTADMPPASPAFPITPPSDGRPLSMIPEDYEKGPGSTSAARPPPPSCPLPALPPRSSSRSGPSAPAAPRLGSSRSPAPAYASRHDGSLPPLNVQATSLSPAPSIEVSGDGDSPTITAATTNYNSHSSYATAGEGAAGSVPASPDEVSYLPTLQYAKAFLPGDIIPAPPLKEAQLDCFSGHSLFLFSRNEDHPVGCMACRVEDRGARFTCSHCSVRICGRCRDALVANGRDLRGWVKALRA